jgi:hypothetical protein
MEYIEEILKDYGLTDDAVLTPKLIREAIAVAICCILTEKEEAELEENQRLVNKFKNILDSDMEEIFGNLSSNK